MKSRAIWSTETLFLQYQVDNTAEYSVFYSLKLVISPSYEPMITQNHCKWVLCKVEKVPTFAVQSDSKAAWDFQACCPSE